MPLKLLQCRMCVCVRGQGQDEYYSDVSQDVCLKREICLFPVKFVIPDKHGNLDEVIG